MDEEKAKIHNASGSGRVTIPKKWRSLLNLDINDECNIALVNGKHGLFFAVWAEDQPNLEEAGSDL